MGDTIASLVLPVAGFYLLILSISFVLVYAGEKRLPPHAPMGLVMSLFLPALGHLYVYEARSLWYAAGLLALGAGLTVASGWWVSTLVLTPLSFGLMYWRLVMRGEGAPPEKPELFPLTVTLDAPTLARLNDLMDAAGTTRDAVVARAIAAMPMEE